jgi:hypothetical protein
MLRSLRKTSRPPPARAEDALKRIRINVANRIFFIVISPYLSLFDNAF